MLISKIERQKKNSQRYNLYLDNQFWIGVDEDTLLEFRLMQGKEISENDKQAIITVENFNQGYRKAINYLSRGMRTILEVEAYLLKHLEGDENQIQDDISRIINKLLTQEYLNNQMYADAYVRTTALIQRKGPDYIRQTLLRKGIELAQIDTALKEYPDSQRLENMKILAQKYIKTHKNLPQRIKEQKLRLFLLQNGFNHNDISKLSMENFLDYDINHENSLLEKEGIKQIRIKSKKFSGFELKRRIFQSLLQKGFEGDAINAWIVEQEEYFERNLNE